ncbi:sigma-54-dependent transcriptional regulator [Candidatus Nitrosacidococcus tergens]|uniref:Type 4 fimbriae expression regulatory protein PilR n=1 Tax=Candidatus Nitrosacidococcus tergens TaxID=553981 RepID=A0A7G1QBA2_9GAMM|nr:sigma-54 dependent transcriptional regulator [Candidatus Nitrosacidococcus tergens]CAB1277037.1 Type 4 fimbriae expression regulatory protein PilR [Candidatus Nitrosacidococcus tergens]
MNKSPIVLVVDDEPDILELLDLTLMGMKINCQKAMNFIEASKHLKANSFNLCLTDMRLPDGSGLDLVKLINQDYPQIPVAVITAYGSVETAVEALKSGAFDFISKPLDVKSLRNLVKMALKMPFAPLQKAKGNYQLLGESSTMEAVRSKITKLACSQAPVYISGESGTGKELVARLIHRQGPRASGPFVPVNCGAIPESLMESEFFGHEKGSFTGASRDKEGLFQAAQEGTLFLDEVADLPIQMQVKLLRAIQERAVRPIGSQREVPVDVRILCATHQDLSQLVNEGKFRQDLFYRLNIVELQVPPLRERAKDIPVLAKHILTQLALRGNHACPQITPSALEKLQSYPFPGNVRELENILERALVLHEGGIIDARNLHLPKDTSWPDKLHSLGEASLERHLEDLEKQAILRALEQTGYNKTAAARLLGITFRALRYRLKKLNLE